MEAVDGRTKERSEAQKNALAQARAKAQEVRSANKDLKEKEKQIRQIEKQQKASEINSRYEKLKKQSDEGVTEVPPEPEPPVVASEEPPKAKTEKKKRRIIVVEAESSADEYEIELPKPKKIATPPKKQLTFAENPMLPHFS